MENFAFTDVRQKIARFLGLVTDKLARVTDEPLMSFATANQIATEVLAQNYENRVFVQLEGRVAKPEIVVFLGENVSRGAFISALERRLARDNFELVVSSNAKFEIKNSNVSHRISFLETFSKKKIESQIPFLMEIF